MGGIDPGATRLRAEDLTLQGLSRSQDCGVGYSTMKTILQVFVAGGVGDHIGLAAFDYGTWRLFISTCKAHGPFLSDTTSTGSEETGSQRRHPELSRLKKVFLYCLCFTRRKRFQA